ncbi:Exocyst complex component exo84 [Trichinella pseudospiralis]
MTVLTSLKNNVPASQTGMQAYIDWAFHPSTSFIEIENEDFPNFSHNYRECDAVASRSSFKTVLQQLDDSQPIFEKKYTIDQNEIGIYDYENFGSTDNPLQ